MKKLRKIVASIVMLSVAFCMVPGMSAQADTCGGLEEVDVYTPGEDEVIQDPVLHWAVRSAMNAIKARPKAYSRDGWGSISKKYFLRAV